MRSALLAFLVVAAGSADAAVADDPTAESRAFVEVVAPRDSYYVHEVIRLRVRFGIESEFLRANVVQLFQRNLDLPIQIEAPWTRNLPGTIAVEDEAGSPVDGGRRVNFALDDGVAAATPVDGVVRDGRKYAVWEIERSFLPERPGGLAISAPTLRFAYATRFQDGFVQGRSPADRRDASVSGAPLALTIRALPEEGKPPEFTGAVGRFAVTSEADRRDVEVGESLKLKLRIEGAGDLAHFDAPRLDGLADFHVFGVIEDTNRTRRVVTYDLSPLDENVKETPSIPFAYFDPGPPAAYHVARTAPIPLHVRPRPRNERKPVVSGDETHGPHATSVVVAAAIAAIALVALAFAARRRARNRTEVDPHRARVRGAATAYRTLAADPDADLAHAFASFLAECLRCSNAAVITPDLAARLLAAGVSADLAGRVASMLEGLVATRYGGAAPPGQAPALTRALVGELESAFLGPGTTQ